MQTQSDRVSTPASTLPLSTTARRIAAVLVALACAACADDAGGGAPGTGCAAYQPPPGSHPGPVADEVQAGRTYSRTLQFPTYPCIQTTQTCYPWVFPPFQICTEDQVQGQCSPSLALLRGPAGAEATGTQVRWPTARADEGLVAELEVETRYPAGCTQLRHAWTTTVLPGPPAPVLRSVSLDRDAIRPGDTVTVVAEFEHGTASWDFGILESGVPATSPALGYPYTIHVRLVGELGEVVEETRWIGVWRAPSISRFVATPALFEGSALVQLSWDVSEASTIAVTPLVGPTTGTRAEVAVSETTTFRLEVRNPLGDLAAAEVTVTKVLPPAIEAFTATPAAVAVGTGPVLAARFSGGAATLGVRRGAPGAPRAIEEGLGTVESGVPIAVPPQRGADVYRVTVTNAFGRTATAELPVPVVGPGSFTVLPASVARTNAPRLVALPDGRVLVLGGYPFPSWTGPAELLDVEARTATLAPDLVPADTVFAAVLGDGRVIASGWGPTAPGAQGDPDPFQVFDPAGLRSTTTFPAGRSEAVVALYGSGVIGLDGQRALAIAPGGRLALLDADAGTAVDATYLDPGAQRGGWASCRLADGRVLLSDGTALHDPATNTVSATPPPATAREQPFLVCLADGTALLVGGKTAAGAFVSEVEQFDPAAGTWTVVATAPANVGAGAELEGGRVLLLDATQGWVLALATGAVSPVGRLAMPRLPEAWQWGLRAEPLPDGRVAVHGEGAGIAELFTP